MNEYLERRFKGINKYLSPTKKEFAEFLKKAFDYCIYIVDKKYIKYINTVLDLKK
ncbi:MAG: hypothetical protein KAQ92_02610 [Candidatus Aenigmarchaeota archaeon]|nr:hypothetical protein [Candidatus Aenigmarchaeota archaeon]